MFALIFAPHGRKVISSNPMSLPIPPGALFVILKTICALLTGVVKKNPYCFHIGEAVTGISPLLNCANTVPFGASILKVILGKIELKRLITFIIHAANS